LNERGNSRINNNLKQVGGFFNKNIKKSNEESSSVWYKIYNYLSEEKHLNVLSCQDTSAKIKTDKFPYEMFTYLPYSYAGFDVWLLLFAVSG